MRIPFFRVSIFTSLFFTSISSFACSCASDLNAQVNGAEKIFLAKAVSAQLRDGENEFSSFVEVEFSIIRELKGTLPKRVTVKTRPPGGDCGVPITLAQTYVVFLQKGKNEIHTCGGSHEVYGFRPEEPEEILKIVRRSSK
jgi:hypothetical protein